MEKLLLELLAEVLGTTAGDLTKEFGSGETQKADKEIQTFVRDKHKAKIELVKKDSFDEGHGQAHRTTLTKLEKEIATKLGVDKSTVEEMIDTYITKSGKSNELTADDIRNSEVYKADIGKIKTKLEETEKDFNTKAENFRIASVKGKLKELGTKLLKDGDFVIPEGETGENLLSLLENALVTGERKVDLDDKGNLILLGQNNNPAMDDSGNVIKLEDYYTSNAKKFFVVAKADDRESPGNKNNTGSDKHYNFPSVTSAEEFIKASRQITDLEEREAFNKHYREKVEPNL